MTQYSITHAHDHFSKIVKSAESGKTVKLTRRGQPVAVLLSVEEYHRLQEQMQSFEQAVLESTEEHNV